MALNPQYLDSLPNTLVDMYSLVEIDILEDMARRISTYDFFIPAAMHQNQKLQELGMVQEDIIKALSAMTGQTQQEIVDLLTEAGEVAVEDDVEYYKAADVYKPEEINSEALHKQLNAGLLQTQQAFKNITRTTANTATKQFENALDRAWVQINSGGMDYNTAIHRAIKDLSEQGIGSIAYKSGRVDSLEVAVRRAIVTGANQTAAKTQEVLADELGVDLVEVTAHGGARPDHAKWQGKVFSRNGDVKIDGVIYKDLRKATGYGSAGGLCGINCRHTFHPYVHGAPRTWTDKQIKDLDKKNISYNGENYTEYEASQMQRGIERDIRSLKRQVAAIEAGGGDASAERAKLRKANKAYTDFTEQTGLKKQQARTKVGTPEAQKVVDKANKTANVKQPTKKDIQEQRKATENSVLTNNVSGDKIDPEKVTNNKQYKALSLEEFKNMKHAVSKEERKTIYGKTHFSGYVNSSKAKEINEALRTGGVLSLEFKKVADTLQSVIDKNTITEDINVIRYVKGDALEAIIGIKMPQPSLKKTAADFFSELDDIPNKVQQNHIYTEKGFLSTSGVYDKNVMQDKNVVLKIKVPKGTHGYITTNYRESEIIFGQNTNLRIEKTYIQDSGTSNWKVVLECVIASE